MATCVLCGCDIGFLGQKVVHICATQQTLCGECDRMFHRADKEERERLRKRMLVSPHLRDREKVQEFLNAEQEAAQRREHNAEHAKRRAEFLDQHMQKVLRCCDRPMRYSGTGSFTYRERGSLAPAAYLGVAVFDCPVCGQIKFYDPDFIPDSLREKEDSDV